MCKTSKMGNALEKSPQSCYNNSILDFCVLVKGAGVQIRKNNSEKESLKMKILVVNAGSSSLKYQLLDITAPIAYAIA